MSFENLLRTDHTIDDGCTGGPLVDARGRVAGMILGRQDDGITFALPLEGVQPIVDALARHTRPERPFFGIGVVSADDRRRARFGIEVESGHPLVAYLVPGSPAVDAGVKPGDQILAIDGRPVASVREAGSMLLAAHAGGAAVKLQLRRRADEIQVSLRPAARPDRVLLDPSDELQEGLEVTLQEITGGPSSQQGLLVSDLARGGRGESNHFRKGDLITEVDGKSVRSFEAFNNAIRTKFKDIFSGSTPGSRTYASSYILLLQVRTEDQEKVTRDYVNLFPDFLAPPVY